MASVIDLDRVRRNDDRLSTLQLILSGAVDLQALKDVLRVNTKVSEVIIYVDESFLVELPVPETHDLFRTIGGMPNLQKLGFHSQSGSSGVLSIQALIAITSHATRMVHFGISDVALWGSQSDFQLWATQLQTQLFLQSFCVCECELLEPSKDCPLDPLLTVLSILPSLEALFLQAATANALGELSPEAVGAIGMAPQLQDLRLGNFELKHSHMEQMAQVLPNNTILSELKLDACHEFKIETASCLARILKHNRRLKSLELGLTKMMNDDCAIAIAESLHHNTTLESFTLSKGANSRFRPTLSKKCQAAFVAMLHQNYKLETLVLFQRFPVKKEFKLFLTLNKYGRGKLLMNHSTDRENWIQAIYRVNDDLDSIFYYLSINPSLCNHCFEEPEPESEAESICSEDEEEEEYEDEDVKELEDLEETSSHAVAAPDDQSLLKQLNVTVGANLASTAATAVASVACDEDTNGVPCAAATAEEAIAVVDKKRTRDGSMDPSSMVGSCFLRESIKRLRPNDSPSGASSSSGSPLPPAAANASSSSSPFLHQEASAAHQQQHHAQLSAAAMAPASVPAAAAAGFPSHEQMTLQGRAAAAQRLAMEQWEELHSSAQQHQQQNAHAQLPGVGGPSPALQHQQLSLQQQGLNHHHRAARLVAVAQHHDHLQQQHQQQQIQEFQAVAAAAAARQRQQQQAMAAAASARRLPQLDQLSLQQLQELRAAQQAQQLQMQRAFAAAQLQQQQQDPAASAALLHRFQGMQHPPPGPNFPF